ncbi:hypothetical protein CRUP_013542, partial [Coryphaenoides rupestris]
VYQQVGTTSSSFIGPACRPAETTEDHRDHRDQVNNNNIEQSLSDFYRELETLDLPDSAAPPPGQHANRDQVSQYSGPGRKRHPQPDWQNWDPDHHHHPRHWDPYHHHHQDPKRPRSSYDASWRPHPPQNRPPFWGHPGPRPPPPPWFSWDHSQSPGPRHCVPRHVNPDWAPYPHHPQDSQSHPPDGSPPPSMCPPGCGPSDPPPPPPPPHPAADRWGGGGPSSDPLVVNGSTGSGGPDAWRWGGPPDPTWPQSSSPPETKPVDLKQADYTTSQDPDYTTSQDPDYTTSQNPDYPSSPLSLILMRGELACTGPSGLILSTDDYFLHADGYQYEPGLLSQMKPCSDEAMLERRSPLIIDNTNLQAWEMKPYVTMPDTAWKFDPAELEKRNKHGVPQQKISQMLDRFCFPVSVETVMSSREPPHASGRPQHQRRRH